MPSRSVRFFWLLGLVLVALAALFLLPLISANGQLPTPKIYWSFRFPRTLLAGLAGGGLALAGLVFQALFRNPLATPYTLGIASGASFGAALCLQSAVYLGLPVAGGVFIGFLGIPLLSWGAFAGAFLAMLIVYGLSQSRDSSSEQMLLAGVAVNFFFAGLIVLLQYVSAPHDALQMLRWTMGGVQDAMNIDNQRLAPIVFTAAVILFFFSRELNVITTGRERALSLGVDVDRFRNILFVLTSLLVGAIVSVTGPIGFVGLMVPHLCRLVVGPHHQRLIPATVLFGGLFLAVCDTLGRCLFHPGSLPVGIVTGLLGGPFFLWLLLRRSATR